MIGCPGRLTAGCANDDDPVDPEREGFGLSGRETCFLLRRPTLKLRSSLFAFACRRRRLRSLPSLVFARELAYSL